MKKILLSLFYLSCFLALSAAIYRLAVWVPPNPWETGYDRYRLCSGMIAVIVSALAVGGAVLLEMVLSDFGEDE